MRADHPAVAAELARLDAVADAREAAAAEARDAGDDAAVYVEEVAGRARWAADRARALATDASARPVPAKPIPRVHCSRLSLATFRREYVDVFCLPFLRQWPFGLPGPNPKRRASSTPAPAV